MAKAKFSQRMPLLDPVSAGLLGGIDASAAGFSEGLHVSLLPPQV